MIYTYHNRVRHMYVRRVISDEFDKVGNCSIELTSGVL